MRYIPDGFAGKLLDVPVGTAVFTYQKYKQMPDADITCLDCSEDMLAQARQRLSDCANIMLMQGDVGQLRRYNGKLHCKRQNPCGG